MKFNIFILVAGLCLVAVSAKTVLLSSSEEIDYEYVANDIAEDVTDVDAYVISVWFGLYFTIKHVLTTLKGVKCTLKEVEAIKDAAQTFVDDITACGETDVKKVQQLITTCNNIIATSNAIFNLNENVCSTSTPAATAFDLDDETAVALAGTTKTSFKCFFKYLNSTLKLKYQIRRALYLIKRVPTVAGENGVCINTAVNNLSSALNQFPTTIKTCSKLIPTSM